MTGVLVAVDNAAFKFDRLWSYNVPSKLQQYAVIGARVLVPFGKGSPRSGIILGECQESKDYKSVIDIEKAPEIGEEMVELIHYLKETTFCTYYDAVKAVLPKNLRLIPDENDESLVLSSEGHTETVYVRRDADDESKLTARQREVLEILAKPMTFKELHELTGVSRDTLVRMEKAGLVTQEERWKQAEEPDICVCSSAPSEIQLSQAQQKAFEEICSNIDDKAKPFTTLLRGVTSSGKTLIYVKLMESMVEKGKSVMLLVPEIALATQLISRVRSAFGDRVGIIHSALSDTERTLQWRNIREGKYDIVVGTRSAVFAPLSEIGLIIIDEEQEDSYCSDMSPRYKTASVAAMRVKTHGGRLLLSSATPSVESYYMAESGKYNLVTLNERYGQVPLPKVTVTDMRDELTAGNAHSIGRTLYASILDRLEKGEQVILLINRRGYRTVSVCTGCGKTLMCSNCSAPMVWHRSDHTHKCHYCGSSVRELTLCPECGNALKHTGIGTQRVEEELEQLFPDVRILRLDLDSTAKKGVLAQELNDFENRKYDIIVGTQMIAKGLDFANVTLVGVLSIDSTLLMPSYKAYEKAFDMLTQVVGRAGRGSVEGEAVIQTIDPYNPILRLAAAQDYEGFYEKEIILRKAHLYPPFCRICSVSFSAGREDKAKAAADMFMRVLREVFSEKPEIPIRALGPAAMRVVQVKGQYRYRVLLKCRADKEFRELLRECLKQMGEEKSISDVRISIDLNNDSDL